jgi:hypothetical protein
MTKQQERLSEDVENEELMNAAVQRHEQSVIERGNHSADEGENG